MALYLDRAANEYINHLSAAMLDDMDPVTLLVWARVPDLSTNRNLILNKYNGTDEGLSFYFAFTSGDPSFRSNRETDATWAGATALSANFTSYGLNKWMFVAYVLEIGVTPRILIGDRNTAPTEPSGYTSQTAGSGNISTDAGQNLVVGNGRGILSTWRFHGDIASIHLLEDNLSNADIINQWRWGYRLDPTTTRLLAYYGLHGASNVADLSGNGNNGTVSGAGVTVSANPPFAPPFGFDILPPIGAPVLQTLDVDIDLDAILRLTKSKVLDLDAILRLTSINTVDLDAILRLVKTEDVDLDAILRLAKSKGVDLDSILRLSKLSTLDLDAILSLAIATQTKTLEVTADVYNMLGWAWGHSDTSFVEIPEKWTVWKAVGGGAATYDTAYGLLQLKSGEVFYSDVKDIGSVLDRLLTIDIDKYGSGSGTQGTIEWRGSTTSFVWNAGSPSWGVYPDGGSIEDWRYVQVRVTG